MLAFNTRSNEQIIDVNNSQNICSDLFFCETTSSYEILKT